MGLPGSVPELRPKQRFSGRFWDTREMLDFLSTYYGTRCEDYPRTWSYRTLIALHREQNSVHAFRKGYGPDWKAEIRPALVEYTKRGKIPYIALKIASERLREIELEIWTRAKVEEMASTKRSQRLAA